MLLSSVLSVLLIPLCLAMPLHPRAATDIINGITKLQNDIATLQGTLSTFEPHQILSAITALQIQKHTKTISADLQSLINTSQSTDDLNSDDSGKVATAVVNLSPNIKDLLNNIVAKKPAFATAVLLIGDLSKTVEQSLTTQRSLSKQFGDTLTPKLSEPYKGFAPLITGQIDGYFASAVAAYASCEGLICLPPFPSKKE